MGAFDADVAKPTQLVHTHPEFAELKRSLPKKNFAKLVTNLKDGRFRGLPDSLKASEAYTDCFSRATAAIVKRLA